MGLLYALLVTQGLSLIGSRMTSIALGIWLFKTTGHTMPLLLTSFFTEVPGMFAGGLAGALVDRWPRKFAMILGDAGQALGTLLLVVSLALQRFQLWQLYLLVLLQGTFRLIQQPATDASLTLLVPEDQRERINGFKEMLFPLAGVIASFLAGLLYLAIGIAGIMSLDLVTFFIAVFTVYLIRIPQPKVSEESSELSGSLLSEAMGGFRFLSSRPALLGLVLYFTLTNFLLNGPLELVIPYLVRVVGSERSMGILLSLTNGGALAGALLIAGWGGTRPRVHTIMIGMLINGVMMILFGASRAIWLLAPSIFLMMVPLPINNALFTSILQVKVPADLQGRVFGAVAQLGYVAAPLSFLLTGPLVDRYLEPAAGSKAWRWVEPLVGSQPGAGMGLVIAAAGLIIILVTIVAYASPRLRHLEATLPDYEAETE